MPYRRPAPAAAEPRAIDDDEVALLPVAILLWVASVASCALHIARGEPLDGEATLGALCVIGLPYLAFRHIKER